MKEREKPVCRFCGSDDITIDAVAAWDPEKGDWVLESVLDGIYCIDCGETAKYAEWVPNTP